MSLPLSLQTKLSITTECCKTITVSLGISTLYQGSSSVDAIQVTFIHFYHFLVFDLLTSSLSHLFIVIDAFLYLFLFVNTHIIFIPIYFDISLITQS
jgi:hypothetical protein